MVTNKIARIVIKGKINETTRKKAVAQFCDENKDKRVNFLITSGGFLSFNLSRIERANLSSGNLSLREVEIKAENAVVDFINKIEVVKLRNVADYFIIGVDSDDKKKSAIVQMIAVYDLSERKIIHWTGKSYPTGYEWHSLEKYDDLRSHFLEIENESVAILGCHDLCIFHPRSQPIGERAKLKDDYLKASKKAKPTVVLHLPHFTDHHLTWCSSWNRLREELPSVKHYASGINYIGLNGDAPRKSSNIQKVLAVTKFGDVLGN